MTDSPFQAPAVAAIGAGTALALKRRVAETIQPTIDVQALYAKTIQPTIDVQALYAKTIQPTIDVQALYAETIQPTIDVQALYAKTIQPTIDVQALYAKTIQPTIDVQALYAKTIQPTIDVQALYAKTIQPTIDVQALYAKTIQPTLDSQRQIVRTIGETLNGRGLLDHLADVASWIRDAVDTFQSAMPPNLHTLESIKEALSLTRDEGLPLVWVPRQEIVQILLEAPDAPTRRQILMDNLGVILDDCMAVLDDCSQTVHACKSDVAAIVIECANQSKKAIRSLNAELHEPAQSHAANVIDSILLHICAFLGDKPKRIAAIDRAKEDIDDEWTTGVLILRLALRPLVRAYEVWYPNTGKPIPDHFNRHVTTHSVGQPSVFKKYNALIAVMLATSLTRQLCHEAAMSVSNADMATQGLPT